MQKHVDSAKTHIIKAIDCIEKSTLDDPESIIEEKFWDSTYLPRFQFILCQIENAMVELFDSCFRG